MWLLRKPAGRIAVFMAVLILGGVWFGTRGHGRSPYTLFLWRVVTLAREAELFNEKHGRYPHTIEEWSTVTTSYGTIDGVLEASKRLPAECALSRVIVPGGQGPEDEVPLLVITGNSARVEIYRGRRYGMSRCLWRPGKPPEIEGVTVLANEPWTSHQQ